MIKSSDITVVIQGPFNKDLTPKCIGSIRSFFPSSKIIYSTWRGEVPGNLDVDLLIENHDPGAFSFDSLGNKNNLTRQIVSSRAGINECKSKYCLKVRSDVIFINNNIMNMHMNYGERSPNFKFFQERVVVCSVFTRHPRRSGLLFHPSDWISFGLTSDVRDLWDVAPPDEPYFSQYFRGRPKTFSDVYPSVYSRLFPEQYVCINFIRKHMKIDIDNYMDFDEEKCSIWENIIANNFIVLNYGNQIGVRFDRYDTSVHNHTNLLTNIEWQRLYTKICDKNHVARDEASDYIGWIELKNQKNRAQKRANKYRKRIYLFFSWLFTPFLFIFWLIISRIRAQD